MMSFLFIFTFGMLALSLWVICGAKMFIDHDVPEPSSGILASWMLCAWPYYLIKHKRRMRND